MRPTLALGTDTGGSIRCPAAFCGVVGIKPTYGLVSRYGLVAYANSLEQIGPIAPTVEEAAALLDVIAGPDDHDATTREEGADADYASAADGDVDGLDIGVPTELVEGADEGVVERFWDAMDELESQGATVHEVSLPSVEHAVEAYYVIAMSEASSNLARYDGVRYGESGGYDGNWNETFAETREEAFGDEVKRRILLGTYALSAGYHDKYYKKAQDARAWLKGDFDVGVRGRGRARQSDDAHAAVRTRRESGRPAPDVPRGREHRPRQPRQPPRDFRSGGRNRRSPRRRAVHRAEVRREARDPGRKRVGVTNRFGFFRETVTPVRKTMIEERNRLETC